MKRLLRIFFSCSKHGWACYGKPCPDCKIDPPNICTKHGWMAMTGCPKCQKGEP